MAGRAGLLALFPAPGNRKWRSFSIGSRCRAGRTSRQALQSLSAAGASSAVPGTTDWKQAVTGLGQEDSLRPSQVSAGAGMPLPQPRGMLGGVVQSWLWFL